MTQRLPTVNSDDGTWGAFLNDFINKEHYDVTPGTPHADSGQHKNITIKAGSATGGTAPIKFTSGTVLGTPEAGAMEFNSDKLYFTITTGPTRKTIAWTTPRVGTVASSATPTINTDDYDAYSITGLATAITSFTTNLSGSPSNFQKLIIRIKDDGSARTITWGASFEAKGVALPTTTVISKVLTVGFIYDSVSAKWGCVASAQEA